MFEPPTIADAPSQRGQVEVLADQLMAAGDRRGELLALELAAALSPDAAESRRLTREAQRWRSLHPSLAWPPALADHSVTLRGGLPISVDQRAFATEVEPGLLGHVRMVEARIEFDAIAGFIEGVATHAAGLEVLDLHQLETGGRPLDLDPLARLSGLSELRVRNGLSRGGEALAQLERLERFELAVHDAGTDGVLAHVAGLPLRELSLISRGAVELEALAALGPSLERLELLGGMPEFGGVSWAKLRELSLMRDEPGTGLLPLPVTLESLDLFYLDEDELDALHASSVAALTLWDAEHLDGGALRVPPGLRELVLHTELPGLTLGGAPQLRRLEIRDFITGSVAVPSSVEDLSLHADVALELDLGLRLKALGCDSAGVEKFANARLEEVETLTLDLSPVAVYENICAGLAPRCTSLRRVVVRVDESLPKLDSELDGLLAELATLTSLRECRFVGRVPLSWLARLDERLPGVACLAGPGSMRNAGSWPRYQSSRPG
ncbi:hypothetical protein PPSIR1_27363 [Plesiocystis pacifica SIR-1]|uniref:Leucine-rich repeat domain-containing protein n=1 Tax=Plesiocystis pacifica SIR-1 TaxID=391625 RepID=A6G4N7_9BACT|nr:hypothetical protein [Plesiocystis pacifica]EDM79157.1 hypothetical protein PPSIR1_27363 [Plesiocystis pacifica SIR-1]